MNYSIINTILGLFAFPVLYLFLIIPYFYATTLFKIKNHKRIKKSFIINIIAFTFFIFLFFFPPLLVTGTGIFDNIFFSIIAFILFFVFLYYFCVYFSFMFKFYIYALMIFIKKIFALLYYKLK